MHALLIDYSLHGAGHAEHLELCEQLAPAVAAVRGLVSATWLANLELGRYGCFYVFETKPDADRFIASELFDSLRSHRSLERITASEFSISQRATALTRGPTTERSSP